MDKVQKSSKPALNEHLSREFLRDGRIVAFKIRSLDRETLDTWATAAAFELEHWDEKLPFLNLQDFSDCKNFSFTPYLRQKSEEITSVQPDKTGRTAVVIPKSLSAYVVCMFFIAKRDLYRQRQVFFSREEAVRWLEEWLNLDNVPT